MPVEQRRSEVKNNSVFYPAHVLQPDTQGGRFGSLGLIVGTRWETRRALFDAHAHQQLIAGIAGSAERGGADSVVLSGAYEDDEDEGDTFIYTGAGGRGPHSSHGGNWPQIEDQSFSHLDNYALQTSFQTERSVRVFRGPNEHSTYAPASGFRYDGLYKVKSADLVRGKSGHDVCKFRFERDLEVDQLPLPTN